jgi:molybdopterin-guanine dinucleotide biosynthesis protein A
MNYAPTLTKRFPVGAYLLAGGASSRMGQDKALLPLGDEPLLVHLAKILTSVSEEFHLVAPPGRYEAFGFPTLHDRRENAGPLAGIEAALENSAHDWNLVLACDLARIEADWLIHLCEVALTSNDFDCVASAASPNEANPLCAVWRKSALPTVRQALDAGKFRVRSVLEQLQTQILIPPDPGILANWNRPEDLPGHLGGGKANRGG